MNGKPDMTRKRLLAAGGIVALITVGATLILGGSAVEVDTALVRRSDIRAYIDETARTRLIGERVIRMPFSGRLARVPGEPGDAIRKGELLAEVDVEKLEDTLDDARRTIDEFFDSDRFRRRITFHPDGPDEERLIELIQFVERFVQESVRQAHAGGGFHSTAIRNQVFEAERRVAELESRIDEARIESPLDGIIIERMIDAPEYVDAGTPLARIGDLHEIEITVDVRSQDIPEIEEGDEVEVFGEAVGRPAGQGLEGWVHRIAPAGFESVSSLGIVERRVRVTLRLDDGARRRLRNRNLGSGFEVEARIFTDSRSDVLVVPRAALIRSGEQYHVCANRNGRARMIPVSVGLMNDEIAEVNGIADTEQLVLSPPTNLTDGAAVVQRHQQ